MTLIGSTERLRIVELVRHDHAPFILELLNEPAFLHFIGDKGVRDLEGANAYIDLQRQSYDVDGFGLFAVEPLEGGGAVGISGLLRRPPLPDVELGFAFLSTAWGSGFATEAGRLLLDLARDRFGLRRVAAITAPDNEGSIKVLRKLDFLYEEMIELPGYETPRRRFAWSPTEGGAA